MDEEQMDERIGEEPVDEAQYEELTRFLRRAVNEATGMVDGEAFLAWMGKAAPQLLPDLLARLPDDQARKSFTQEFGRSLWNSIPLPDNGFRPRPLPEPERNDTCPCGSGKKYKKCCSQWSEGAPELDAEGVWMLMAEELPLEQVEAMGASGRVPRSVLGGVATALLDNDEAQKALALVRPLFERPERLDDRDAASLNTLLEAYDALDLQEERWAEAERLAGSLRPSLRAVLWENLARAYAVEGEMEEAWSSLERARQDDPESPALGPLEVSLLLAEGRTAEAQEKARYWRARLREGDLSEPGFEFLARVGENAEETQLQFSFGDEVAERIHMLEHLLANYRPPAGVYRIEPVGDDPAEGRLVPAEALRKLEDGFEEVFYPPVADPDSEEEDDEDWDPWDEERAEEWLGFLVGNPQALDSVDVLEDVAHAVSEIVTDRYGFLDRPLLRPILDRGLAILRQALGAHPGITCLPGELEPNGSALALIVSAAAQAHRFGETDQARERLEWLRTLEPHSLDELAGEEGEEDLEDEE
jgi:tetratricopeptide (TPR) repeat protein